MDERSKLTFEEKKKLNSERQKAVRDAWKNEKERVANGEGTRDWTPEQQKELMEAGSVEGYDGHHMKSVNRYPEYAGNADNIQLLTRDEHINGAHQRNTHSVTNGYYNADTEEMTNFNEDELKPVESKVLSEPCYSNGKENVENQSYSAFNESAKSSYSEESSSSESFNRSAKNQSESESKAESSSPSHSSSQTRN